MRRGREGREEEKEMSDELQIWMKWTDVSKTVTSCSFIPFVFAAELDD